MSRKTFQTTESGEAVGLHRLPPKPFKGPAKRWWIEWGKQLGDPKCPYAYRWLIGTPFGAIRLHHWLSSDDDRAFHDHPWWFVTFVVSGEYIDVSLQGSGKEHWVKEDRLTPGSIRFRPALHKHWVKVIKPCWTLLITGLWLRGKWIKASRYFFRYGNHPCAH